MVARPRGGYTPRPMNLLPVVQRELRVAARRDRTYYGRVLAAGAALAVFLIHRQVVGLVGLGGERATFLLLTHTANWLLLGVSLYLTADALSRERREGTLGLLFLSRLGGWDVVLGKLTAQATLALYGLLAAMPVLALSFLGGGVSGLEFAWTVVALVNTLFFGASLGLLISAAGRESRSTHHAALGAWLFYWLALPGLAGALPALGVSPGIAAWLDALSPLTALEQNPLGAGGVSPGNVLSLGLAHLEAWGFLAAAAALTARAWRERPVGQARRRWQEWWRAFQLGGPAVRTVRRQRLLEHGPFYWLFARRRWKAVGPPALVGGVLVVFGVTWWLEDDVVPPVEMAMILGFALHVLLKFWISAEAAAVLVQHRQAGTFELLLSTPLTIQDILAGQFRALRWQFGPAVLVTVLLTAAYPLMWALLDPDWDRELATVAVPIALLAALALVGDAYALAWLASWRALTARRPQHAAGSAAVRILLLPWVALILVLLGWGYIEALGLAGILAWWALIGFVSDSLWFLHARDRLWSDFRVAAAGVWGEPRAR